MKKYILLFICLVSAGVISCHSSKNNDLDSILQTVSKDVLPEPFYYSSFFIKKHVFKEKNYFTKDELLKTGKDNFWFLYSISYKNNEAYVEILRVKNGAFNEYKLSKHNGVWRILDKEEVLTKVDENEGTLLYIDIRNKLGKPLTSD
ncbi:hypothetical protein CMT89_04455 [Elizabethkingia anophelis]|uniref:hypothetical protein n=1 Tax=Elizabethkingia anophelis TaxID=1117645 RepID=UPI000CE9AD49|nr:hypothetical protein [Elizabethkingia anophelis]AVF49059.1 hypothetical protein AL491_13640 [Elizabethkingia anophelis]AVF53055.1 hypothetical protein AL492_16050 [Elizabethkingia anophelis]MBG0506732.1 hypothetical protein [Elizabethkingia anophelis]MCT4071774.1 hypothetical protein [Elizabethkingia anophelis]MDV2458660.1 hypothetical protein [Elizabethkingia anophelis]